MPRFSEALVEIEKLLDQTKGNSDRFAEGLRHNHIPHLSFSQITTVEFCKRRYFLQYEQLIEPHPTPKYFIKGKLLHQIIASSYSNLANKKPIDPCEYDRLIAYHYSGEDEVHLRNAVRTHLENLWQDCEVVAIEKPFVMMIDENLPPCVGVVDLILKQNGCFILIDHKSGRDFYPQDDLQMAIYVEYIKKQFGESQFHFHYENYRWVNNLYRIRKPAFYRSEIFLRGEYWIYAIERIRNGYRMIEQIQTSGKSSRDGECFRCPYRQCCYSG